MKALVTVEGGETFQIDTLNLLFTTVDSSGKPVSTDVLANAPVLIPGRPLVIGRADGTQIQGNIVVTVIYRS